MRAITLSSVILAAAIPCAAADLSASDVSRILGVQISKVTTERNKADGTGTDITYMSASGDAVLVLYRGPVSMWAGTRDAYASMGKPFPGLNQAYRYDGVMGMVCAPGTTTFVCVTPSTHYLFKKAKPSDEALLTILKAAL